MSAVTQNNHNGDGSTTQFSFTFPYLKASDVKVSLDAATTTNFSFHNATTIQFTAPTGGATTTQETGGAPKSGVKIRIFRETGIDDLTATFYAGSAIKSQDLNDNFTQNLYVTQEVNQRFLDKLGGGVMTQNLQLGEDVDIIFEGATDNDFETTLQVTDPTADRTITLPNVTGTIVTTGDTGSVTGTMLADGTITAADIATDAVIEAKIQNGAVTVNKIGADAVNGTKIADNSIDSEHYVDGSIDREHLSADIIDGTKIADDAIANEHIATNAVNADSLADNSVDVFALQANSVVQSKLANASVGTPQLIADAVDGTKIADDAIDSEHYADGSIDNQHIANGTIQAGKIANGTITTTQIEEGTLDNRYFTETESDARYFRQDSTETIASGDTWSNSNAHVATTAAINARIVDLIDDVGGFIAIANQTSFPATNPQGSTGQAAILSIAATTATLTPSGTTVTIANGAGTGNTVTITGVPSAIGSGFGFLVESTSTLHTYTFHRLVPKATEVTTVAANASALATAATNVADINNFADLYIISSSQPSTRADGTSLQEGDLWYDSSNDNVLVYTGSSFSIITPSQSVLNDVAIVSGAITYIEDLGLITNAVTTGSSNGSLDIVADALEDEITFTVTAATGKFIIDGVDKPALTLYKGWTYTFDLSDASNASHPFRFSSGGSAYSTNVTVTGTQGQAGAKISIKIPESQPTSFIYYCTSHANMGNTITVKDDPIKTVSDISANITTAADNNVKITTVANSISDVSTVSNNISNVSSFASIYTISGSAPGSPNNGDLWYDSSSNVLKNYNGSQWAAVTSNPGLQDIVDDTTPQLGGALDGQNNNLNNIGTIDGANLQLDFGSV